MTSRPSQASKPVWHNLEAEVGVLGACLQDDEAARQATAMLSPSDLYRDIHGEIFGVIQSLVARESIVNLVTVGEDLERRGRLQAVGGSAYLAGLVDAVPTSAPLVHYVRIVRRYALLRKFYQVCREAASEARTGADPAEVLVKHLRVLEELRASVTPEPERDLTIGADAFLTPPPELPWDIEKVRVHDDHGWTGGAPKSMKGLLP